MAKLLYGFKMTCFNCNCNVAGVLPATARSFIASFIASNFNVSLDFVSGNIEIFGKQNSLFPSGPVVKC